MKSENAINLLKRKLETVMVYLKRTLPRKIKQTVSKKDTKGENAWGWTNTINTKNKTDRENT